MEQYVRIALGTRVLLAVFASLHQYGVFLVEARYSGSGDSGAVDTVAILEPESLAVEGGAEILNRPLLTPLGGFICASMLTSGPCALRDAIVEYVEQEATERGPDWWNNEGGGGTATIDVAQMSIDFDHYTNSEETDTLQHPTLDLRTLESHVREYMESPHAAYPEESVFEIVFDSCGDIDFCEWRSTIHDVAPPDASRQLASRLATADNSNQISFTYDPATGFVNVVEDNLWVSSEDYSFSTTIDPETFEE